MTADQMRTWLIARHPSSKSWERKIIRIPNDLVEGIYKILQRCEPKERAS